MGVNQKGLHDWIIQRTSAIVMACYIIYLAVFFAIHPQVDFAMWQTLYSHVLMQVATMIVLLSMMWHAWIGVWTVCTDYIKCPIARLTIEALVMLTLVSCFFWGIYILWSI